MFTIETIAFNIESCATAQNAGADRIELCANPAEGGTTPSYGFIKAARKVLDILLYPIIRPRGGDFLFSDESFEMMKDEILLCKKIGCEKILTSGFYPTAMKGADNIKKLIEQADERIIIMPGSGVRAANIKELAEKTGAVEFHSSASKKITSLMTVSNSMMNEKPEYIGADEEEIRKMIEQLKTIAG